MKIIGIVNTYPQKYVAIIDHREVQKVFDKYYGRDELKPLEVGAEIDLGAGFDFRSEIRSACGSMQNAMKQFEESRDTLRRFAAMLIERTPAPEG